MDTKRLISAPYVPSFGDLRDEVAEINELVIQLRAHGGDVVFLKLPASDEHAKFERETFPNSEYWDRFAQTCQATCLDSNNSSVLRGFSCPDGVHLSESDCIRFTRGLVLELVRLGLAP